MHLIIIFLLGVIAFAVVFGRGATQSVLGALTGLFVAFFILVFATNAHAESWPDLSGIIRAVAGLKPIPVYVISDPRPQTPEEEQAALVRTQLKDDNSILEEKIASGMLPAQRIAEICANNPAQACQAMQEQEAMRAAPVMTPMPVVTPQYQCVDGSGAIDPHCAERLPPQIRVYIQQSQSYSQPQPQFIRGNGDDYYARPGQ
jgi:hypothetical protein